MKLPRRPLLSGLALYSSLTWAHTPVNLDAECMLTLSVSGFAESVSQCPDGLFLVGSYEEAASFRIEPKTRSLLDVDWLSCTISDETSRRLVCGQDVDSYLEAITVDTSNYVSYQGSSAFYACTSTEEHAKIYLSLESCDDSCSPVSIKAGGCEAPGGASGPEDGPGSCAGIASTLWQTSTATESATVTVTITHGDAAACTAPAPFDAEPPSLDKRSLADIQERPYNVQDLFRRQAETPEGWTPTPWVFETQAFLDIFKALKGIDKANIRNNVIAPIEFGMSKVIGTTELSGCTTFYIMTHRQMIVAHYPEGGKSECPLGSAADTRAEIIPWLDDEHNWWLDISGGNNEFVCNDVYVLIGGSSRNSPQSGVRVLRDYFVANYGIPDANIRYWYYNSFSGIGGDPTSPQGKTMGIWTSTDDSTGTIGVYTLAVSPRLWLEYRKAEDDTVQHIVSWGTGAQDIS